MIRVELGAMASQGVFNFTIPALSLSGRSKEPLLAACRLIKRALGHTSTRAGLFRGDALALECGVEFGATQTVKETATASPYFAKYAPFKGITPKEAS